MKRLVTIAAAVFFLAAMTSPSLAHKTKRKHSHKKPVATQTTENVEAGRTTGKTMEPMPPVESQPHKIATPPPAPATTGAAVAPVPSQPGMTDKMTDKATDMAKDKATEAVQDKATDAVMDAAKPSGSSVPSMPGSNPVSAVKPAVPSVPGMAN